MDLSTIKPEGPGSRRRRPPTYHARRGPVRRGYPVLARESDEAHPTRRLFAIPRLPPRGSAPAPPPPGPPRASWRRSRCAPFRQPGATHGAPTAVESAHNARPSQGDEAARLPATPRSPAAPVQPCRGSGVHRRRPARGAAARQGGNPTAHAPSPRGPPPSRARTEPRTSPRAGAGAGGGCRADP